MFMGNSTKKLLIVLGLLLVVLLVFIVRKHGSTIAPTTQQSNDTKALEARASLIENQVKYDQYAKFINEDLGLDYQTHGAVPVQAGTVGRANPFLPY